MKSLLSLLLFCFVSAHAWAAQPDFDGMVELRNRQKIHAVLYKAAAGKPTVVLINGLTYTTKAWDRMVTWLTDREVGVLTYDPRGMGKTLEETGPAREVIPIETQAQDLELLLAHFNLADVDLVGLSYGGALAAVHASEYPERVRNVVLMAPYVRPLKQQDQLIQQKVATYRLTHPADKRSEDEIYDDMLRDLIFQTYPIYEPVVKEHPWRLEAIFRMVQGIRKVNVLDAIKKLPRRSVHLMVAGKDQYVPRQDHDDLWAILGKDQKVSRINIEGSEHKIPEAVPTFAAGWVELIARGDSRLRDGREFTGSPSQGKAVSGTVVIDLPKDFLRFPGW